MVTAEHTDDIVMFGRWVVAHRRHYSPDLHGPETRRTKTDPRP
ncbi:hypothetical protein [Streptomyces sp. Inha503]